MIERRVAFAALLLPFLYVAVDLLPRFPLTAVAIPAAFLLGLLAAGLGSMPDGAARLGSLAFGALLVGTVVVANADRAVFGSVGPDLMVGSMLAVPWVLVAVAGRADEPLVYRFAAFGSAVTVGLLLLTAAHSLSAGGTAYTGESFLRAFASVNSQQLLGIAFLLVGAGSSGLPVHDLFDPLFVGLTAVSLLGLLLVVVRPETERGEPLPIAWGTVPLEESEAMRRNDYGLSPAQRQVFRERSRPEAPAIRAPPGADALAVAAASAGVFLALAFAAPFAALLVTVVILAAAAVALMVVVRPGRSARPSTK